MDPEPRPLVADVPVGEEVPAIAWSLLWRERLGRHIEHGDRYRWVVLVTVLSGLFATGFTFTIFAVSLEKVARDLHSSVPALQWVVSGPLLVYACAMPLLGRLGDTNGHRRVYLVGFSMFILSSLLTTLAWNGPSLITIRLIGAIEGAATGPTSMALIMRVFPPADRVKAMGWWSLVGAGAPVIGLVAGGPIVDAFGWRWLFAMQVPLGLVVLLLASTVLRETPRGKREPLDVRGAVCLAVAVAAPLLALTVARTAGWGTAAVPVLLALGPLGALAFVRVERRAQHPILPVEIVRRRNFAAPGAALFFANLAYMGGFIVTPLLLRNLFHESVAQISLVSLFRPLSFSIAAPIAGYVAVRIGERTTAVAGTVLITASMGVFVVGVSEHALAVLVGALVLSGVGMGMASPALQAAAANAVEPERLGIASAAQQMMSQVGAVVGMSVLATVAGGSTARSPFVHAYAIGGALAVAGVAVALVVRSAARTAPQLSIAA